MDVDYIIMEDMDLTVQGERGFTLIEIMIATGLSAMVVLGLISILTNLVESLNLAREQTAMRQIRANILQELNRPDAWVNTYQADNNFSCLLVRNPALPCLTTAGTPRNFDLRNRSGQVLVYSSKADAGYTFNGEGCNEFLETATDPVTDHNHLRCAIHLYLTWELINWGGSNFPTGYFPYGYYPAMYFPPNWGYAYFYFGRVTAQVKVRGIFTINDKYKRKANAEKYNFTVYKEIP